MAEPEEDLRDFLRTRITDPNLASRSGTEWIVSDWPYETNLTTNHFPRISIINQFENGKPFGIGSTNTWNSVRMQLDIWVKSDHVLEISGTNYEGYHQVRKLMRLVTEAIRQYWITDLAQTGKVVLQTSINWYPPRYDYDYNLYRQTGDVTFAILKSG